MVLLLTLGTLLVGCLPDPQSIQLGHLFDQLTTARALLSERPPRRLDEGCGTVSSVRTRLGGEPGLSSRGGAWSALQDTARALLAVCGQATLLLQPSTGTAAMVQARQRWQQGVDRELGVACSHLHEAAAALGRPAPC